jgi:hypothetical protein
MFIKGIQTLFQGHEKLQKDFRDFMMQGSHTTNPHPDTDTVADVAHLPSIDSNEERLDLEAFASVLSFTSMSGTAFETPKINRQCITARYHQVTPVTVVDTSSAKLNLESFYFEEVLSFEDVVVLDTFGSNHLTSLIAEPASVVDQSNALPTREQLLAAINRKVIEQDQMIQRLQETVEAQSVQINKLQNRKDGHT